MHQGRCTPGTKLPQDPQEEDIRKMLDISAPPKDSSEHQLCISSLVRFACNSVNYYNSKYMPTSNFMLAPNTVYDQLEEKENAANQQIETEFEVPQETGDIEGLEKENKELREEAEDLRKKVATARRKEERLRAERNQHNLKLTMMKSGIDQLMKDPTIPSSMLQSLKLLQHSANFSLSTEQNHCSPPQKKIKLERDVELEDKIKQKAHGKKEYVEDIPIKQEVLLEELH